MDENISKLETSLGLIATELSEEFSSLRSNRPSPSMVEDIEADVYGSKMPIKQLGSITTAPPRSITITTWDAGTTKPAADAIVETLKVNPSVDGATIHIELPQLTEERKAEVIKQAGKLAEEARIKIRSFRENINKKIEKSEDSSEDDKFANKEKVQTIVAATNKTIEDILNKKTEELKV